MRDIDKRECGAFGRSPKDALRISLRTSFHALTALDEEGKVLAMFGVTPLDMLGGKGTPWFLGSGDVFNYARDLMDRGPKIIAWWHETFTEMNNLVSAENLKAISLLRHWGAVVDDTSQMIGGVEFVPFRFSAAIQGQSLAA
jgi:hypothetical protein